MIDYEERMKQLRKNSNTQMSGLKWSDHEEKLLVQNVADKLDFVKIAEKHKRTITAIKARLMLIAKKDLDNGVSMEDILQKTKLSENEIYDYISRKNKEKSETTFSNGQVNIIVKNENETIQELLLKIDKRLGRIENQLNIKTSEYVTVEKYQ